MMGEDMVPQTRTRLARKSALSLASAVSALATVLCAASATAQSAPAAAPPSDQAADSDRLADVIVMARRTSENVQSTPVAVTAISGEQLKTLAVVRLDGISQLAPSVRITQASGSANAPALFLRGVGTVTTALYQEPAVALYLDGVYTPRPTGATFDLPDLSSVEVLRGPQGTLFGRNTTGGAILLNTAAPTDTFGGKVDFSFGSQKEIISGGVINTGLIAGTPIRMKFTAQVHSRDGWVNTPGYSRDQWGGALFSRSFGWTTTAEVLPGLTLDNRLRSNYAESFTGWQPVGGSVNGRAYFGGGAALGGAPFVFLTTAPYHPTDIQYRDPRTDGRSTVRAFGDSFTATYNVSPALTIKEIAGWSTIDELLHANLGGGSTLGTVSNPEVPGVPIQYVSPHTTTNNPGLQRQFSSETQLSGKVGDFSYLVGFFYYRERTNETIGTIIDSPTSATTATSLRRSTNYNINSHSYAGFGQISWKPSFANGQLEISGGIRYTKDRKNLNSFQISNITATVLTQVAENEWNNTGWSGSISYKFTPSIMLYARASSAYRSGGYNAPTPGAPPFGPETPKNYEIGLKSDLADHHIRLNLAAFRTDFANLQVNAYNQDAKSNTITNAGAARIQGFEAEGAVKYGAFSADANIGYVDPKYKSYVLLISGVLTDVTATAQFAYVPHWTYHVGAQYDVPFGDEGKVTLRADYSGKTNAPAYTAIQLSPNVASLPYLGRDDNVSARIIVRAPIAGKNMRFSIFGENLTNRRNVAFASDFSSVYAATFNRPRYYGASVGIDF
jgi:iron complex outermembrane receptor protein